MLKIKRFSYTNLRQTHKHSNRQTDAHKPRNKRDR